MKRYGDVISQVDIIPMGSMVTPDYRTDRVRLYVDDIDRVVRVEAPGIPEIEGDIERSRVLEPQLEEIPEELLQEVPTSSTSSNTYTVEEPATEEVDPAVSIINSGEVYKVYCEMWGGPVDCKNGQVTGNLTSCNSDCSNPSMLCPYENRWGTKC